MSEGWTRNSTGYFSASSRAWEGIRGTRFSHLLISSLRMPNMVFIASAFADSAVKDDYDTFAGGVQPRRDRHADSVPGRRGSSGIISVRCGDLGRLPAPEPSQRLRVSVP